MDRELFPRDVAVETIDFAETSRTRTKYDRAAKLYDLLEAPMELIWYRRWRQRLLARAGGNRLLEVGVGTGKNLPYHPTARSVVAIDLSQGMLARARAHCGQRDPTFVQADVQRLPFRDGSFDTAFATFVFCSVPDPVLGLREVRRVLKRNGRLLVLEHVRPGNPTLARWFDQVNATVVAWTGVHINRRTAANIRAAGFDLLEERNLLATVFKSFVATPGPHHDR